MPYRSNATECLVHLLALHHLSPATRAQCHALRQEAGRLWTDLVRRHRQARLQGQWLEVRDLEQATKGGQYALGSQTVQALCQQFAANLATATKLRKQEAARGQISTQYPHHAKAYRTVIWKDQGLVWDRAGHIGLKNGLGRPSLSLPLPTHFQGANIRKAELLWRADHYELALTIDTGQTLPPPPQASGAVAGVDLGEVHVAAITTARRHALVISGRQLRACKQWRNKSHARLSEKLSRCQPGSRHSKRLQRSKAKTSAKVYRQQRDILHKAAKQAVEFCAAEEVRQIVVGDVRDIQTGVSLGTTSNQKISQWPHGQFARYVGEKAARKAIRVDWIDESYSTRTCSHCGYVHTSSPRGRRFRCLGCGVRIHRDVNGSNNICSKGACGAYGQVQADHVKYLRPNGVAPPTRAKVASAR